MKEYLIPEMEIVEFEIEDVIVTSPLHGEDEILQAGQGDTETDDNDDPFGD